MEVAKLTNVTRVYKIGQVETRALNGVSMDIQSGEFTSLVGPSGSGKTTLLQLIGCLDQPTSGKVFIAGQETTGLNRNQRADLRKSAIGFVFQFFALIPTLTAYENVEMPLLLNGKSAAQRKQRVMELLEGVGMADRANNRPDQLSGGQQQRVAVARALATDPKLILADEPTANLDTENGEQVMEIMKKLNSETGATFVFATHDPRVIKYASRIVTLKDGVIDADNRGS
ncbi:MAG: macrolide ABC transporter ATP-binding protein [Anaerolineaceae bacterium]|jgi:putative ABC transport system ATP-binding protein|nr:ABC transporter ATP-binding protein [Anaerolineae bacterium]MBL1171717.1 ABC transporter ATP-binding protein [Chloroflexota bacterium]MBV6468062.1 putative ABC transporter ATP-binding protein YknY [Anaerolineales bacterium]MCE7858334.1 ABC transporter ATP-binding protein [Chloroflexi bacterium CFX2]MDL1926610.1 ABC transporter ATP-binding protein [Anaerolineae bacterium AMX1]GJQ39184.1 MAG: macrolide ABC transporter ATP-binding protein [Anaerolineaceae bacterium]